MTFGLCMQTNKTGLAIGCVGALAVCVTALALLFPRAETSLAILMAQDDPARLSDVRLEQALPVGETRASVIDGHIRQALEAGDPELAESFVAVAAAKGIALPEQLTDEVRAAVAAHDGASAVAWRFARGLVTGEGDDAASLSGTLAGDLFVFGDVRDVLREGKRLVMGEEADRLILGLAATGIVVTAATYVSAAGVAPLRAGLTLVKDARKTGRLGAGLTAWTGRAARNMIDTPALTHAVQNVSLTRPAQSAHLIKAAFKAEKAGVLVRLAKDTGRVNAKIGAKGTLDVLRIADGPKDVARAARLAEAKGKETRATLKLLGRGALLLASGAFNLAWWVFAALIALIGTLASIKSTTERLTLAWLHRRKRVKARRLFLATQASSA